MARSVCDRLRVATAPDNKTWPANSSSVGGASPQKYLPDDCQQAGAPPGNCGEGAPTAVRWYDANSTTVVQFSALCYLVAREMIITHLPSDTTTVYGLVQSAKGGTPVEGWIAGDQLHRFSKCGMDPTCPIFSQVRPLAESSSCRPFLTDSHLDLFHQGATPADDSHFFTEWSRPSVLYNQMMAPIAGYQALAVLWDQGEANMDEGFMLRREQYACLFREMILSWRQAWGNVALPFVFPQLHACGSQKNNCSNADCSAGSWTTIRSAQDDVFQTVPAVGMAVSYDQGFGGVHSPHKQPVGHRMALELRRVALGEALSAAEQGPSLIGACLQVRLSMRFLPNFAHILLTLRSYYTYAHLPSIWTHFRCNNHSLSTMSQIRQRFSSS